MPSDALKKLSIENFPISNDGRKASDSIAEVRQQVNLGATPAEARATLTQIKAGPSIAPRFNPTIPDVIPSTALAGNKTFEDVMDTRTDLETKAVAKQQLTDRIKGTGDRIGASSTPSFNDPDGMINRLLLNRVPTETESQRAQKQASAVENRRNFAGDIATARTEANDQFGLPDLTARKAEVTQQYAERQNQLDADIKRIEDNASKRGVDRAAVEDMKRGVKSAALEDLANYAAIEAAISGSITEARTIINDTINDKKAAFELENQSIQQEIDYLNTLAGEENQREAQQLQFALNERKSAQDAQLAKEKEIKEYAAEVASEGADDGTIQAILKSGTAEEALRYAAPYLGRTQRMQANASMAASAASRRNSLISAAKEGDPQALSELNFDPRSSTPLGEYANVIDTASLLVGAERGQETRRAMASAIERGDYQTTYSMLANNVQSSLQGESASRFGAARTDIQVLSGLRDVINEFEQAGGDTGFLVGNADQIARKFGQLATDPKFAALAVQLEREFQAYRQAMTGAAFSPAESAEYEKVNPSSTKSLELNLATIDGAIRQLENRVVGTTEAYVPGSREIYDIATGKEKTIPTTAPENEPVGSVIEYDGVRYRKVGEDAYEPI